jgi:hypothetical protein
VQAKVATHVSHGKHGDSTTYSVDVLFRYSYLGQSHDSSRYMLSNFSDGDHNSKSATVNYLNRNRHQTCYVNPSDPDDAVIDRSYHSILLILPGMGLVFGLIGLFVLRPPPRTSPSP